MGETFLKEDFHTEVGLYESSRVSEPHQWDEQSLKKKQKTFPHLVLMMVVERAVYTSLQHLTQVFSWVETC